MQQHWPSKLHHSGKWALPCPAQHPNCRSRSVSLFRPWKHPWKRCWEPPEEPLGPFPHSLSCRHPWSGHGRVEMPKSRIEKRKEDREAALSTESAPNFSFFTWGAMIVLCMFLQEPEDTLACFVRKTSQPFLQFQQMPCTTNLGCQGNLC